MCIDTAINIVTAICTLALAAIAIWQDQVLNLFNPARGEIVESNFAGKEEGNPQERLYTYHVKAVSCRRWRPLKGAIIRLRQINRITDAGQEQTSFYPVWRQLPEAVVWAGRYPIPLSPAQLKPRMFSESDFDVARELLQRFMPQKKLFEV